MADGPGQRAQRRVGTMVRDKYRIDAFIATGSMANVYAATHRNGSRVALKILHKELATDKSMAERFKREGYFANAIGHPGVVRAIDDDLTEDGCAFIVMELLEGENLDDKRIRLGGRIPLGEALLIGDSILEVLAAAHNQEVLHRDLKPENVFLTRKNEVKLLDFGVARFNDGRSSSDMTAIGMVLGTPAFMPPEQALGRREEVDARSDIWGVGATLFMVITGEAVHEGGDAKMKLIATARKPARPLRDVAPEIPRAVASVIDRALAFDKIDRWADANAMREALRWARMSLDDQGSGAHDRITHDAIPPPVTRRQPEDEPTLAGRSIIGKDEPTLAGRSIKEALRDFDDNTARRSPVGPKLQQRHPMSDGVVTSAPPVTQRDKQAPSMAVSEGPTFSLRNDPIFSLRRTPNEMLAPSPDTERLPHQQQQHQPQQQQQQPSPDSQQQQQQAPSSQRPPGSQKPPPQSQKPPPGSQRPPQVRPLAETQLRPLAETQVRPLAETQLRPLAETQASAQDAGAIFRAALANTAYAHDDNQRDRSRDHDRDRDLAATAGGGADGTGPPRPAAGMPPELAPAIRTNPGIGAPAAAPPAFPPPAQKRPEPFNSTMPMPAVGHPYAPSAPPPGAVATFTGPPPMYSAPQQGYASQQQQHGSLPPLQAAPVMQEYDSQQYDAQQYDSQRPDDVRRTGGRGRPSMTPENPGPLLATIAPKRSGGAARVIVPIMIGVLAGIGTYVVVVRQRAANASHGAATTTTATVDPSASASAAAAAAASASAALAASSSAASSSSAAASSTPSASPTPTGMTSVAVAPSAKPKRRPRPRPTATATSAATTTTPTATATETATAEPAPPPAPTPAPAPTPQDSLPRKEPE